MASVVLVLKIEEGFRSLSMLLLGFGFDRLSFLLAVLELGCALDPH